MSREAGTGPEADALPRAGVFPRAGAHDTSPRAGAHDNPLRGIALTTGACIVFAIADTIAKFLSTGLPIIEIAWIRYVLFFGMAGLLASRSPDRAFRPRNPKLQVLRGLCVTGSSVLFVYGIREMTMAQATTISFLSPLLITILSIPMYAGLFHAYGLKGLAIASDIGILAQTASLAILLHRKRLVSFAHLEFPELARAFAAALAAFAATAAAVHFLPPVSTHSRDVITIAVASIAWAAAAVATLLITGSKLPQQILRRR